MKIHHDKIIVNVFFILIHDKTFTVPSLICSFQQIRIYNGGIKLRMNTAHAYFRLHIHTVFKRELQAKCSSERKIWGEKSSSMEPLGYIKTSFIISNKIQCTWHGLLQFQPHHSQRQLCLTMSLSSCSFRRLLRESLGNPHRLWVFLNKTYLRNLQRTLRYIETEKPRSLLCGRAQSSEGVSILFTE